MSTTPTQPTRRRSAAPMGITALATAVVVAGLIGVGGEQLHASAAPHRPTTAQVNARAAQNLVQVQAKWSARIGVPLQDGTVDWSSDPIEVPFDCTGWFVGSKGDIATAGHCVDTAGFTSDVIDMYVDSLAEDGSYGIDAAWVEENREWARKHFELKSKTGTAKPDMSFVVYQGKNVHDRVLTHSVDADLVDFSPYAKADVALLHVDGTGIDGLTIAARNPSVGAHVTAVGFPGIVGDESDRENWEPSFKTGAVSSHQTRNGFGKLEIDASTKEGMSGGPVLDSAGNVVGIVSYGPKDGSAFEFISDTASVRTFLTDQHVRFGKPFAGIVDRAAVRSSLATAVVGVAGALLIGFVLFLVFLIRFLLKGRTPVTAPAPAGFVIPQSPQSAPAGFVIPQAAPTQAPQPAPAMEHRFEPTPVVTEAPARPIGCGHQNLPGFRFCATCGTPLTGLATAA